MGTSILHFLLILWAFGVGWLWAARRVATVMKDADCPADLNDELWRAAVPQPLRWLLEQWA